MIRAESHYNNRVLIGDWKVPTKHDIEIAALKAMIEIMNMSKSAAATKNSARNKARRRKARQRK